MKSIFIIQSNDNQQLLCLGNFIKDNMNYDDIKSLLKGLNPKKYYLLNKLNDSTYNEYKTNLKFDLIIDENNDCQLTSYLPSGRLFRAINVDIIKDFYVKYLNSELDKYYENNIVRNKFTLKSILYECGECNSENYCTREKINHKASLKFELENKYHIIEFENEVFCRIEDNIIKYKEPTGSTGIYSKEKKSLLKFGCYTIEDQKIIDFFDELPFNFIINNLIRID